MTAATINAYVDHTLTPSGPLVAIVFTAPSDDSTPTVALPATGDGKTWAAIGGITQTGGTALGFTISSNTATVVSGMNVSEVGTLLITKY